MTFKIYLHMCMHVLKYFIHTYVCVCVWREKVEHNLGGWHSSEEGVNEFSQIPFKGIKLLSDMFKSGVAACVEEDHFPGFS